MRDRFTGDQRDRIKWGAVVDLASQPPRSARVIHVQMLRKEDGPALLVDCDERPIHSGVWRELSDTTLQNERLSTAVEGLSIASWVKPFVHADRAAYFAELCEHLTTVDYDRKVVFLDPDTGIEPQSRPVAEHVLLRELTAVWHALAEGDWLAVYQHAHRSQTWVQRARDTFKECCSGAAVTIYRGKEPLAQDVAILAAQR